MAGSCTWCPTAVPLQLVSVVLTRNEPDLRFAKECFRAVSGQRQYHAMTAVFYN